MQWQAKCQSLKRCATIAQLEELRVCDRKIAGFRFDSRTGMASLCLWERHFLRISLWDQAVYLLWCAGKVINCHAWMNWKDCLFQQHTVYFRKEFMLLNPLNLQMFSIHNWAVSISFHEVGGPRQPINWVLLQCRHNDFGFKLDSPCTTMQKNLLAEILLFQFWLCNINQQHWIWFCCSFISKLKIQLYVFHKKSAFAKKIVIYAGYC